MVEKKHNFKKATIIPVLCAVASVMPINAKANGWGAVANFISGVGTGMTAYHSNRSSATRSYTTGTVVQTYPQEQGVIYIGANQSQVQPAYQPAPAVVYSEPIVEQHQVVPVQSQKRKVYYRVVSERKIERPGQDPIIETVYEEVPVQQPQYQPTIRYTSNQGR